MSASPDVDRVLAALVQNQKELGDLLREARTLNLDTTLHFFWEDLYAADTNLNVTKAFVGVPHIQLVLTPRKP